MDDVLDRLQTSGSVSSSIISSTMPTTQTLKALWFVSEDSHTSIEWENIENGNYAFAKSSKVWTSNNKGGNNSTAISKWEKTLPESTEYQLKYRVSSETGYDKFTIILDDTTIIANGISGLGEEITYTTVLNTGTHTLVAKYVKDSSQGKNNDCAYIILEPVSVDNGDGAVYKIAEKIANNGNGEDYRYHPISTNSIHITRPNGKTVEESFIEIESENSGTNIIVDTALSSSSMNPIANSAVTEKMNALEIVLNANKSKISMFEKNSHAHENMALLNALSYLDGKLYYNDTLISGGTATDTHSHSNKAVLDSLSISSGKLYCNGSAVGGASVDNSTIRFNTSNQLYAEIVIPIQTNPFWTL